MTAPLEAGAPLPAAFCEATVLSLDGVATPLRTLWADGPALVVWIRHYG